MVEVQVHGFEFQDWVGREFFNLKADRGSREWDVEANENLSTNIPSEFSGMPISIKTARLGSPIGLGDIIRQRAINYDFGIICGFWRQVSHTEKKIVEIASVKINSEKWESLWGNLSLDEILKLDNRIKDRLVHYTAAREFAKSWKYQTQNLGHRIVVNPKIDSKTQRRVQCSMPNSLIYELCQQAPNQISNAALWERAFPNPIKSTPRTFK